MDKSLEERLKSLPLSDFPNYIFRDLSTAYTHKGGYEFKPYNPELDEELRSLTFGELPEKVFERVPLEKIADRLLFHETHNVLKEHLSTKEQMARRFKVIYAYDLNNPAPDAERVSEQLEDGWKQGYTPDGHDYLTSYVVQMYLLEGEFNEALDYYVRKTKSGHDIVAENYEARCREMLEEVADEIREPINALREKYGQKPLN